MILRYGARKNSRVISCFLAFLLVLNFIPNPAYATPRTGYLYKRVSNFESGCQYVIAAKVENNSYALTSALGSTAALSVAGDFITSTISDNVLWTAATVGENNRFYLMIHSNYLSRNDASNLSLSDDVPETSLGAWQYSSNTISLPSPAGYLSKTSGSSFCISSTPTTEICIYKKIQLSVVSIAVTHAPSTVSYLGGQLFDPTGMQITATYNDGSTEIVSDYSYSPTRALQLSDDVVMIYYGGKTASQAIHIIAKTLTSIKITKQPNKISYIEGQSFDPAGMIVTACYDDGSSEVVQDYSLLPSRKLTTSDHTINISYLSKSTSLPISVVEKTLTKISVATSPTKTAYIEGQPFDPAGMIVNAWYDNGTIQQIDDYTCTPSGLLQIGDHEILISYLSRTTTLPIIVSKKECTRIVVTQLPSKTTYIEGQAFDSSGMVLTAFYNNGSETTVTDYECSPAGPLSLDNDRITVTAQSMTTSVPISVIPRSITSLIISTPPIRTQYIEGQAFDPSGMVVIAKFNDSSTQEIHGYTLSPERPLQMADSFVTIAYLGHSVQQNVLVVAKTLTGISISKPPMKTQYIEGQSFDPTGMVLSAHYNNNTVDEVSDFTYTPAAGLQLTDTSVVISYQGKTVAQPISVSPKSVVCISVTVPPVKTTYIEGQKFDPTGTVITAYYNDDSSAVINDYTFSPLAILKTTDTVIIFEYAGKSASQNIKVVSKSLENIIITSPPNKTDYIEGQFFNPEGMVITARYDNGSIEQIFDYEYSPTRALVQEDTLIVITYGSKQVTQTISVREKSLVRIAVTSQPTTVSYIEGQQFDPTGLVIQAYYDNGTSIVVTDYTYSPTGALKIGDRTATVTYYAQTADISISVKAKTITALSISNPPNKTTYTEGELFDPAGLRVSATYDSGLTEDVSGYNYSPASPLSLTDSEVEITYLGFTVLQRITVLENKCTLASLTTSAGTLSPAFDPNKTVYTVTLDKLTKGTIIKATCASILSSVSYYIDGAPCTNGEVFLDNGKTKVLSIIVKAQSGSAKTYTVNIYRADYGTLKFVCKGIGGEVYPGIGLSLYTNEALTSSVGTIKSDNNGIVSFRNLSTRTYWVSVTSVPDEYVLPDVVIPVIATDGVVTEINLVLQMTKVLSLNSTQLRKMSFSVGRLSPAFNPDYKNYTLTLNEYTSSVTIAPALADPLSKLYINGRRVSSLKVSLANGKKATVSIQIRPKKGKSFTYKITVIRDKSTNADLAGITVSGGKLDVPFHKSTTKYVINLSNTQSKVRILPKLAYKYSIYMLTLDGKHTTNRTVSLKPGQTRTLKIIVKSQAKTLKTYTLVITRAISKNADLSRLSVSRGTLQPKFSKDNLHYSVLLSDKQPSLSLTLKTADVYAKYSIKVNGKTSSKTVSVKKGETKTVVITVKSQAGNTKTYTVIVSRTP